MEGIAADINQVSIPYERERIFRPTSSNGSDGGRGYHVSIPYERERIFRRKNWNDYPERAGVSIPYERERIFRPDGRDEKWDVSVFGFNSLRTGTYL